MAAAFGRLCVETGSSPGSVTVSAQPPSGGCVLKRYRSRTKGASSLQPPSGGCVLKPDSVKTAIGEAKAAAFGRLCVETAMVAVFLMFF